jgi:predicted molibdopterin-dependent oxidoreductase YjgC
VDELAMRIRHGDIKILIILEDSAETHSRELAEAVASVGTLIVLSSHMTVTAHQASVLLPVASFAECEGTFTNNLHRVQKFEQVLSTKDHRRTVTMKNSRWDKFGAPNDRWTKGTQRDVRPGWAIVQDIANIMGAGWTFASAKDVFTHATHHVGAFEQLSYELIAQHQGAVIGKAHHPEKNVPVYESHYMKPQ